MKKTIYIHAGTHKTATSSIQNFFFENRIELEKHGCYYPMSGLLQQKEIGVRHYYLQYQLVRNESLSHWENLKNELSNCSSNKIVISHENFLSPDIDPIVVKKILADYDVKLIAYFRHPVDYIESCYREWVQNVDRYDKSINTFYQWRKAWLSYEILVRKWEDALGVENIITRVFDKDFLLKPIEEDFLSCIGVQDFQVKTMTNYNKSLNSKQTLITLLKNRKVSNDYYITCLENCLEDTFKTKCIDKRIMHDDLCNMIFETYISDFQYILTKSNCKYKPESKFLKLNHDSFFELVEKETS